MSKRKVLIIGHFGWGHDFFDGQTIKTRLLYNELKRQSAWKVNFVDTYNYKKRRLSVFLRSLFYSFAYKDIIVALSDNGLKFYIPFLNRVKKVCKNNIYHYVVGGSFHVFLKNNPKFISMVKMFKINWVQTSNLVGELKALGIDNSEYMPNFKPLRLFEKNELTYIDKPPFSFCTFSRVTKEKGISDAIRAINAINRNSGSIVCKLDIYGCVDSNYKDEFNELLISSDGNAIKYCGSQDPMKSSTIISNYFACLFPTYWPGEGFAATVLDANFGGVPVFGTDWNCNKEIIIDGVTGIVYPNNKFNSLQDVLIFAIKNPNQINKMKIHCLEYAKEFLPEKHIAKIVDFIENRGKETK